MNDEIFKGKRILTETEAMWNLALGTVFQDERYRAFQAYRESLRHATENLDQAIKDWLERHPYEPAED